jgi:hypothetical protein
VLSADYGTFLAGIFMTTNDRNLRHLIFLLLLAFGASSPAIAQQGQYFVTNPLFTLPGMTSPGALATYSPLKSIDDETIQLRSEEGTLYIFTLSAETIYCQGDRRVPDWTYLRRAGKKHSITVLTASDTDKKALVVWDRAPSISSLNGSLAFTLPPMCK